MSKTLVILTTRGLRDFIDSLPVEDDFVDGLEDDFVDDFANDNPCDHCSGSWDNFDCCLAVSALMGSACPRNNRRLP
jgi:hypothetical protein